MRSLGRLLKGILPDSLRQMAYRARLRARGRRLRFGPGSRIDTYADLEDHVALDAGASVYGCRVGRWSYLGESSLAVNADIGSFCSIAAKTIIGGGTHPTHMVSTCPLFYGTVRNPWGQAGGDVPRDSELPRTIVGNDVWIGYSAIVLPGVCVGDGAVIGAGAVVTSDVEPYAIVAGVPARSLRRRFNQDEIDWLVATRWWELPDPRLRELRPSFVDVETLRAAMEGAARPREAAPVS